MNKTKIVATIGPAIADKEILRKMIQNGVDAFRINMNYSTLEFCYEIVKVINELNSDRLTAKLLPFVAQESFDHFLWDCDLAFIRGEDSAARAMIAGVPFIWHIYHQEDNAHQVKLQALEKKMSHCFDDTNLFNAWCQFQEGFNNGVVHRDALKIIVERLDSLRQCSMAWRKKIHANGSLAQKLSEMAKKTLK